MKLSLRMSMEVVDPSIVDDLDTDCPWHESCRERSTDCGWLDNVAGYEEEKENE